MANQPFNTSPGRGLKKSCVGEDGTIMTREKRLFAILTAMAFAYPNQGTEAATLEEYLRHLIDLPLELVATACDRLVKREKFLPAVSDIRELVGALEDQRARDEAESRQIEEARRLEAYTGPPTEKAKRKARKMVEDLSRACK